MPFSPKNRFEGYDAGLDLTDFDSPRLAPPRHEPMPSEANHSGQKLAKWVVLLALAGSAYQQHWPELRIVGVAGLSFLAAFLLHSVHVINDPAWGQQHAKRQDNNDIQFN